MIEYSMNGAWGKEILDEQLLERMADFGIEMSVERRRDNLLTIKMCIDNEKIMKRRKKIMPFSFNCRNGYSNHHILHKRKKKIVCEQISVN